VVMLSSMRFCETFILRGKLGANSATTPFLPPSGPARRLAQGPPVTSKFLAAIAPLRVCNITWPNEVAKWEFASGMKLANLRTEEGLKAWQDRTADIYVINSEKLNSMTKRLTCPSCKGKSPKRRNCEQCSRSGKIDRHYPGFVDKYLRKRAKRDIPVDAICVDELSLAKNPTSKRFCALRGYRDLFKMHWGLTGTPVPNTYLDLWAQIKFLDGGKRLGQCYHAFKQAFFYNPTSQPYKWLAKDGAKEKIHAKIEDICLTMMSADYLEVPTCLSIDHEVTLSAPARKFYRTMEKELLLELAKGDIQALTAATLATKLLQITGGASYGGEQKARVTHELHSCKMQELKKLLKKHDNEPVIILTQFLHEQERILKAFPQARMFNEKDMGKWQAGEIPIWVSHPKSMSHGIDGIQDGGRIMIWFTLTYSNETYLQTNARVVRTGQALETLIYRIIARDTIDEAAAETLRVKSDEESGFLNALKALQQMRRLRITA
jgi:hypothetical protein